MNTNRIIAVLLLATVALSSCKILQIVPLDDKLYGETVDNIMLSKHQPKDELSDVLLKIKNDYDEPDSQELYRQEKFNVKYNDYNAVKDNSYDLIDYYNDDDENPKFILMKLKRENGEKTENAETEQSEPTNRRMNKRMFSIFTLLQSMNKVHGHNRQNLLALNGPDSNGGPSGVDRTAKSRGTVIRPPGAPLRWG